MIRKDLHAAQAEALQWIVYGATSASENGNEKEARNLTILGERLAKQYGIEKFPGLPATFTR